VTESDEFKVRRETILAECREQIAWYAKHARLNLVLHRAFQVAAVVLAGFTPVLILFESIPKVWIAIPPALAALCFGLDGLLQCRESWVRFAFARESLKEEAFKYASRTSERYGRELDPEVALDNLASGIVELTYRERAEWKERALQSAGQPKKGDGQVGSKQGAVSRPDSTSVG